jgi:hypothetical protein
MARYTYRRHTEHSKTLCGWTFKATDQFEIVAPDGALVDWPLLDDEDEAKRQAAAFNCDLQDDTAINEARWQARMAGDLEG